MIQHTKINHTPQLIELRVGNIISPDKKAFNKIQYPFMEGKDKKKKNQQTRKEGIFLP